uniref:Uncharacterized protein n=1 Tax=Rhizophora mucronata TaxID=61149 RepID=A0A2P2MYU0_RHIMU
MQENVQCLVPCSTINSMPKVSNRTRNRSCAVTLYIKHNSWGQVHRNQTCSY